MRLVPGPGHPQGGAPAAPPITPSWTLEDGDYEDGDLAHVKEYDNHDQDVS